MRADPTLCFLDRVGRPDEKAIAAEQRGNDFMDGSVQTSGRAQKQEKLFLCFASLSLVINCKALYVCAGMWTTQSISPLQLC